MRLGRYAVLLVFACAANALARTAVWIDTDASIGSPFREVDDAYALVLAFHSPEIRIAGISTTYGNAGVRQTTEVTRDLVRRFAPGTEVSSGAAASGEEQKTDATEALGRALWKEKLTYVALGPLTNLAAFVEQRPALVSRIERVIFVGGHSPGVSLAFGPSGARQIHDANVFKDPEAVRRILRTQLPLELMPVETSSRLQLRPNELRNLRGPAGEFLRRRSHAWLWFWTNMVHEKGGPLFDLLPIIAVTRSELLRTEKRYASIDSAGELIAASQSTDDARPVRFCTGWTGEPMAFVRQRLARESER